MNAPAIRAALPLAGTAELVEIRDPREMDIRSTMSGRLSADIAVHRYVLRDQLLLRQRFVQPIARHATRRLPKLYLSHVDERFGTQVDIGGAGLDRFCFNMMLSGTMALTQDGHDTVTSAARGLVFRATPQTRAVTSDGASRLNLWVETAAIERLLAGMLGGTSWPRLVFARDFDWSRTAGAVLTAQIAHLLAEFARPDGVTGNPVASALFTELMLRTILLSVPHNYSDNLFNRRERAGSVYLQRARAFMLAHAAAPLRMDAVAASAGCSLRTLEAAFRQHEQTTPLAALQAIRLDQVRTDLRDTACGLSTAEISRRYGFTNPARFAAAYRRRFGEAPSETFKRPRGA